MAIGGISRLFERRRAEPAPVTAPKGPAGARAYAIGDVHGMDDMLAALLDAIVEEERTRPPVDKTFVVMLGDLIDRGPNSAQVVERLRTADWGYVRPVYIAGNHEEMLLRILGDEPHLIHQWLTYGGLECAQSYGAPIARMVGQPTDSAVAVLRAHVPPAHLDFLSGFADSFRFGDYLFVHAGIRPGVPLEQQSTDDLRWIREDFLESDRNEGFVVVHGHTIVTLPVEKSNRIGIDTGAYMSGSLTALMIEGGERKFLSVGNGRKSA